MTSPTTPGDELRTAADKIRKLVAAISPPNPVSARFHADDCHVTQGDYGLYDVATAETPECAAYIAAMGPSVARSLADLLEAVSNDPDGGSLDDSGSDRHDGCDRTACAPAAALAIARALNPA